MNAHAAGRGDPTEGVARLNVPPFPGFDRLFEAHDPLASRPFRGRFGDHEDAFELSRGEKDPPHPVRITWSMGAAIPGDVIWTTSAHPLILSARVIDLFAQHGITGWSTYPVRVTTKEGDDAGRFFGLAVTGRCGVIDLSKSRIELQQKPGGYYPYFRGQYFDPESWDGSDLCVQVRDEKGKSSTQRFVTERVVRLLKRHRIRNVRMERLSEAVFPTDIYEIGLQHRLPRDFRKQVAKLYRDLRIPRPA